MLDVGFWFTTLLYFLSFFVVVIGQTNLHLNIVDFNGPRDASVLEQCLKERLRLLGNQNSGLTALDMCALPEVNSIDNLLKGAQQSEMGVGLWEHIVDFASAMEKHRLVLTSKMLMLMNINLL